MHEKSTLARSASRRDTCRSGRTIAITTPGTPPPEPMSITRLPGSGAATCSNRQCLVDVARPHLLTRDGGQIEPCRPARKLIEILGRVSHRRIGQWRSGPGAAPLDTTARPAGGVGDGLVRRAPRPAFCVRSWTQRWRRTPETSDRCPLCKRGMLSVLYYGADGESVGGHRICADCGPRSRGRAGSARRAAPPPPGAKAS